jgi:hypothetical protein
MHFPLSACLRLRAAAIAVVASAAAFNACAQAPLEASLPRIVEVRLVGNERTRDKVILRELDLVPGDIADPVAIESGRQAVLDLGLFREVKATTHAVAGGVVL